ncbi:MAG: hypothetical protein K940chlam3_00971 [Chlamydiae bacterium]|nr:hypothetical protein [Chlamydiota bacterium]
MVSKVDVFAPPENSYKVLHYITEMIAAALVKQGIQTRLFDSKIASDPMKFIGMVLSDKPDCTFSINGLLPDAEGNFLCDMLGVPHVAYLLNSPQYFFSMVKSPNTIMCCVDQFHVRFLKLFGDTHVLFLPNAAEAGIEYDPAEKRSYDAVMLASYLDPDEARKKWPEKYSSDICQVLDEAAEMTLSRSQISFIEAFSECMKSPVAQKRVDPKDVNYQEVFNDLEDYIRGQDRLEILHAIKDVEIHVFGEGDWEGFTSKTKSKIIPHGSVPFLEVLDIMKQSKVVLNSTPQLKYGGHERFYSSYMCGALPITAQYPFIEQEYQSGESAIYYQPPNWGDVNEQVHHYLENPNERMAIVDKGRHITHEKNTWDNRIRTLLAELPPILDFIGSRGDQDT